MRRDVALVSLIACVLLGVAAFAISHYQRPSIDRPVDCRFDIEVDTAALTSWDTNGDGFSDQEDILRGALKYVALRPKYGSRYYAGGYPNDGYGVCTDVVAAALRFSGFDLRDLVNRDIESNPEEYSIDLVDKNIEYRRVKNLRIFFQRNWRSLTLDVMEMSEWAGGDIVVFENHIGIVSDRRNANGVPYLIHHSGEWQLSFEEDVLESNLFGEIVGHFRIP